MYCLDESFDLSPTTVPLDLIYGLELLLELVDFLELLLELFDFLELLDFLELPLELLELLDGFVAMVSSAFCSCVTVE